MVVMKEKKSQRVKISKIESRQRLFDHTPRDKKMVFENPTLQLISKGRLVGVWKNTQPLYFYPFSLLDFVPGKRRHIELRLIAANRKIARREILRLRNAKVYFEEVDMDLMSVAREKGHKVSVICNLDDINKSNAKALSCVDLLIVRVGSDSMDLSALEGIPNSRLLSGVRIYLSPNNNSRLSGVIKRAREIGMDFAHISKRLIDSSQVYLNEKEKRAIHRLTKLQTDTFRVILPKDTSKVFNEKFEISDDYGNSRACYFSRHREVISSDRFYPCYTKSVISSGRLSSSTLDGLRKKSRLFGKTCSDCACIYENDILESIVKTTNAIDGKFVLEYKEY